MSQGISERNWRRMVKDDLQEQRLKDLVEAFKMDSVEYKDLETPKDTKSRR